MLLQTYNIEEEMVLCRVIATILGQNPSVPANIAKLMHIDKTNSVTPSWGSML